MRIAINARSILLANRTGIGRYTYHLIDSLGQIDHLNEYQLYIKKKLFDFKRKIPHISYSNFQNKVDVLSRGLQSCLKNIDVYHSPSPDDLNIDGPKIVVTIHDLVYKTYPQAHTPETIELTQAYMLQTIKKAHQIICISQNTREDLHRYFDYPREKSSVVYNGVDHNQFYALNSDQKIQGKVVLKELGIDQPFILFVGTIEPRKNLAGLLKAFAQLRQKKVFKGKLVVVGMKGWMIQEIEGLLNSLNIRQEVVFTGFVTDEQLRYLYNLTEVFVFPSFYEGFGFPILEAFCCGTAVVTSTTSSCGEIASDAALTVNPHDGIKLQEAIAEILSNQTTKEKFKEKSLKRSKEFSFIKTAQETLKVYENLV